jgi:hypothetical protein
MDLTHLERFKRRLLVTDQFDLVAQDFLTHACGDDAFLELGEFVESPLLTGIIHAAGRRCFGHDSRLECLALKRIGPSNFIHGSFLIGGRMASVMYFDDVDIGVVSIAARSPHPTTEFVRFAAHTPHDPSLN